MHKRLLNYLCDPADRSNLRLFAETAVIDDRVETGDLVSANGANYPIRNGVPRFLPDAETSDSVIAFGNEWNHFNYEGFKANWLAHHRSRFRFDRLFQRRADRRLRPRNAHQMDV